MTALVIVYDYPEEFTKQCQGQVIRWLSMNKPKRVCLVYLVLMTSNFKLLTEIKGTRRDSNCLCVKNKFPLLVRA